MPHKLATIPGYNESTDELQAMCWCGSTFIWVKRALIKNCKTGSCGRHYCQEPKC